MVNYNSFGIQESVSKGDQETIQQINEILKENHDLREVKKIIGVEELTKMLRRLYPKNDIKTLEKILKVPDSTLEYWFKKLGMQSVRWHVSTESFPSNFDLSIVVPYNNKTKSLSAIKFDGNLSYLVGFCIGDGAIQKFMVEAFNKDNGMKEALKKTMQRYGTVQEIVRPDGLWKLRLSSVKIASLIKRNGKIVQDTLDYIFSDDSLTSEFIAGLWDAEGSVLKQGNYFHIYFYNSDRELIGRTSEFLLGNGIKNSIIKMKKRTQTYYLNGRPVIAKKQIYRLGVPKNSISKWRELIGKHLKHSKKSAVVCDIKKGDEPK